MLEEKTQSFPNSQWLKVVLTKKVDFVSCLNLFKKLIRNRWQAFDYVFDLPDSFLGDTDTLRSLLYS